MIRATGRPPNWCCTAAMVRRISANKPFAAEASLRSRVVRRKSTLPSTAAVKSASPENNSTNN